MKRVLLHSFTLGDVDDPEVYATIPLLEWERSAAGVWCKQNARDICYHIAQDFRIMGFRVSIVGEMDESAELEFILRWR